MSVHSKTVILTFFDMFFSSLLLNILFQINKFVRYLFSFVSRISFCELFHGEFLGDYCLGTLEGIYMRFFLFS